MSITMFFWSSLLFFFDLLLSSVVSVLSPLHFVTQVFSLSYVIRTPYTLNLSSLKHIINHFLPSWMWHTKIRTWSCSPALELYMLCDSCFSLIAG